MVARSVRQLDAPGVERHGGGVASRRPGLRRCCSRRSVNRGWRRSSRSTRPEGTRAAAGAGRRGGGWPDFTEQGILANLETWLLPWMKRGEGARQLRRCVSTRCSRGCSAETRTAPGSNAAVYTSTPRRRYANVSSTANAPAAAGTAVAGDAWICSDGPDAWPGQGPGVAAPVVTSRATVAGHIGSGGVLGGAYAGVKRCVVAIRNTSGRWPGRCQGDAFRQTQDVSTQGVGDVARTS